MKRNLLSKLKVKGKSGNCKALKVEAQSTSIQNKNGIYRQRIFLNYENKLVRFSHNERGFFFLILNH